MHRRTPPVLLALGLVAGGAPLSAQASGDSAQYVQQMYLKLRKIFAPEGKGGTTSYLTLANPGIRFDPNLNPKANPDDDFLMSRLLNDVLAPAPFYTPGTLTVPGVYEYIFAFKEQPDFSLPAEERQKLQALMDLTSDASPKMQAYLDRQSKWVDAVVAYEGAKANGTPPALLNGYQSKLNNALSAWSAQGFKQEIESAQEKIQELNAKDPGFWWDGLRTRLNNQYAFAADGKTGHYKTWTYPQYADWGKDEGWVTYRVSDKDKDSSYKFSEREIGFFAKYDAGLVSVSVSGTMRNTEERSKVTTKGLSIEMQVKAVNIYRPWMEGLVFKSKSWRFNPTVGSRSRVAEGDLAKYVDKGPNELPLMPLVPVRAILARGIKIHGQFSDEERQMLKKLIEAKLKVSFAFCSVSASFRHEDKTETLKTVNNVTTIESPDIQLIGFVCDVVPKSPDPDLSLAFKPAPVPAEELHRRR